jgi:hypothetical protein
MAHFDQHCRDCERVLGRRYEDVNRWMDELFRLFGPDHRAYRHHWRGVYTAKGLWGEDGARAAVVHIVRDCGSVPMARSYEQTNLGIVIAPAFLIAERQGKQDSPEAEADFRAAVEKAFKKGRRDGIFQQTCSSVGLERDPDKIEVGGSSPPTSTNF